MMLPIKHLMQSLQKVNNKVFFIVKLYSFLSFSWNFSKKRLANEKSKSLMSCSYTRKYFGRTVMVIRKTQTATGGVL